MSMRALRGLELICLTKSGHFELNYAGGGSYTDGAGKPIDDLIDMGCVGCSASYYTRELAPIDFCPACGYMERKRFGSYQDLQKWSTEQNWKFLTINGHRAFGVYGSSSWRLTFAVHEDELEQSGQYDEIHDLLG
jgi:hypothetical protein